MFRFKGVVKRFAEVVRNNEKIALKRHWLAKRRSLRLEHCEDRRVLAPITVNDPGDFIDFDPNVTTLREAINIANQDDAADDISFDFDFGANDTITLTLGQLPTITESLTIHGPGRDLLAIDADSDDDGIGNSRIFEINDFLGDSAVQDVTISGLTLANGYESGNGGAIRARETLHLDGTRFLNNQTDSGDGGAIHISSSGAGCHCWFTEQT